MNQQPVYNQPLSNQPGVPPGYNMNQQAYGQSMPGQPMPNQMHGIPGQQPQQQQWMPVPSGIPGCPPGLEYLTQIDQLLVKQKVEILEMLSGLETNNKYEVKNSMGQDVYKAKEKSGFCARQCCGPMRAFDMEITDNNGREVIHLKRPLNCTSCCFPCCLQEMTITSPVTGEVLGTIEQNWHLCLPKYSLKDANGQTVLKLTGPFCTCACCSDVNFELETVDGQNVGKITKQWTGMVKEAFTDADNFGVTFPMDLSVQMKAVVLGLVFLIDFMYFEEPANNNNNHH